MQGYLMVWCWLSVLVSSEVPECTQDSISVSLLQNNVALKPTDTLTTKLAHTNVTSDELDEMEIACSKEQEQFDCGLVRQLIEYVDMNAIQDNVSSVIETYDMFTKEFPGIFGDFSGVSEVAELITKKGSKVGVELGSRFGYSALHFAPLMAQNPYYTVDPSLGKARALLHAKAGIIDTIENVEGFASDFLRTAAKKKLQFDFALFDYLSDDFFNNVQLALDLNLMSPGAILVVDDANKLFARGDHPLEWLRSTRKFRSIRPFGETNELRDTNNMFIIAILN